MTQDEVIKLAAEAGFKWPDICETTIEQRLGRFANLIAVAEREKCTGTQEFVTLPREVVDRALNALGNAETVSREQYEAELFEITAIRAALEQPQNHVPDAVNMVPAGWKLVPVEPNCSMVLAGERSLGQHDFLRLDSAYRAMLDAAPKPPTVKDSLTVEQPQAEQPAMTPIAQRKLDDLVAGGYTISGYSVYHEQKHQHGFVTGAGLVGWWKPDGVEYPQPQGEQKPMAWLTIEVMGPRTKVDVEWEDQLQKLPSGIYKLYTNPQPKREPLPDHYINGMFSAASLAEGDMFRRFARAIEAAHNIK